ncbi:MAG TPA: cytochrome c oxidase subunit 3 [Candidatus Tectomicrobia bacterium]
MSEAVATPAEAFETPLTPESWGKLGMWIFLAGDAMSFGTLLAGYGAVRFGSIDWPNPQEILGIEISGVMTFILILSSVAMVKGLSAARHDDLAGFRKWIGLTVVGGVVFLFGQLVIEWPHFLHKGLGFTSNPWGSSLFGTTFYIITGFHGMHVTGGVIYLLCILLSGWHGRYSSHNYNPVEIAGLYWHFVDLVWIMVFTFIYML